MRTRFPRSHRPHQLPKSRFINPTRPVTSPSMAIRSHKSSIESLVFSCRLEVSRAIFGSFFCIAGLPDASGLSPIQFRQCAVLTSFADFLRAMIPLPEHFFRDGGVACLLAKKKIGIRPFRWKQTFRKCRTRLRRQDSQRLRSKVHSLQKPDTSIPLSRPGCG